MYEDDERDGTPSIYIDEVGRGYTDEEAREGLLWMFRPVPNRSHLSITPRPGSTIAPPPADALLSPFHSPSATLACSPTQFNSTQNVPLGEQVSTPNAPSQLVPQLTNSTSNNAHREQVNPSAQPKSEPWWISGGVEECIAKAEEIADAKFNAAAYAKRHASWMSTKIDCAAFLTWFIENYPNSVDETKNGGADFWSRFK